MATHVNELQPAKAQQPICVTENGILTLVKELQLWNAPSPICVSEFESVRLVKDLQPEKAKSAMPVTEAGMVTRTKERHSAKAKSSISVVPSGIFTSNNSSWGQPDSPALAHSTVGFLENTTCTLACSGMQAEMVVSFGALSFSPSRTMSTELSFCVSSSSDGWKALRVSFNSRSVWSGGTSKLQSLPLISSTLRRWVAMARTGNIWKLDAKKRLVDESGMLRNML